MDQYLKVRQALYHHGIPWFVHGPILEERPRICVNGNEVWADFSSTRQGGRRAGDDEDLPSLETQICLGSYVSEFAAWQAQKALADALRTYPPARYTKYLAMRKQGRLMLNSAASISHVVTGYEKAHQLMDVHGLPWFVKDFILEHRPVLRAVGAVVFGDATLKGKRNSEHKSGWYPLAKYEDEELAASVQAALTDMLEDYPQERYRSDIAARRQRFPARNAVVLPGPWPR